MEHPYNIQPLGNIYHSKDNGKIIINISKRRDGSLGTFLSKLNDSIIYNTFFGYFNAKDLGIIALVSNYFYVLSHDRDYWKALVLINMVGRLNLIKLGKIHILVILMINTSHINQ